MRLFHHSASLFGAALLAFSALLSIESTGHAADAAGGPPYKLTVVLDVAQSRVLTATFREQVERELQDGLQAALGDLARVEVTREHPKLADIRERGLGRALDAWKGVSAEKTHFVLIQLVNNEYEIQARQFDGPTGTASPIVRIERTADRAFVARVASLLIEQDFGFSAAFPTWPKVGDPNDQPQIVQLTFPGSGLGVPLSRWVSKGDVFAVFHLTSERAPERIPWCLVQIQDPPQDDNPETPCTGRLFWRYKPVSEVAGHLGYRCVKLGAIRGPVKIRLVKSDPKDNSGPLHASFEVRRGGFKAEEATLVKGGPDPVTLTFSTANNPAIQPFDKVAFVTVKRGGVARALLPFPILDDHTETVPLSVHTDQVDALAQRIDRWGRHVDDAWRVQSMVYQDIRDLTQKPGIAREKIIARAQEGIKRTVDDLARLETERAELPNNLGSTRKTERENIDKMIKEIKKGEKELTEFTDRQEKILKEESSPAKKVARAQLEDAHFAEDKADFGQAIELYKKAQEELKDPKLQEQIDNLQTRWMTVSDEHERARRYIYDTFPTLDTRGLALQMDTVAKRFQICKESNDQLTPRKLLLAIEMHKNRLRQEKAELNPNVNEGDQASIERIGKVVEGLVKLNTDVLDYLSSSTKKSD